MGFNDLATTHPQIAREADGWDSTSVVAGSAQSRSWRCDKGHPAWTAKVGVRTGLNLTSGIGTGCPTCSGRLPVPGLDDLATTHPDLARQADGWDPTSVKAASNSRRTWRCAEGHMWNAYVFSRARDDRGCPVCSGRIVSAGINDLATVAPEVAAELIDADPQEIHAGTKKVHRWRCTEGHEWDAAVSTRTRKLATGCPTCATSGFDPTEPAWLYLLRHEEYGYLQVGITNRPESRPATHRRNGWTVLDLTPVQGSMARARERSILEVIRKAGASRPHRHFDGYTESWSADDCLVASLAELSSRTGNQ